MNTNHQSLIEAGAPALHVRNVVEKAAEAGDALKAARRYLAASDTFLILSGGMGTHKTGAAVRLMADVYENNQSNGRHPMDYMRFVGADELRQAFGYDDAAEKLLRQLKRITLLVIDDLGTEYQDKNGFFAQGLNTLINERYASMRRTIVTTNLTADAFKAQYPRIADRMRESGTFVVVAGESKRRKKQPL